MVGPTPVAPEADIVAENRELQEPAHTSGFWYPQALALLGLGLLPTVPYLPSLWGEFVWDDTTFIEDPAVLSGSGLWTIWLSPADLEESHYWPVVYTSFWLEHKLWGLAPFGYHLVNLLLHLANVLQVRRLLLCLAVPGAWAVAAVFAVHPVHVESVAWIIARKDLLSGLFYLAAALFWIRFTEAPRKAPYILSLGLYTVAMLSKSIAVTLPAALLVLQWWRQGRVTKTDCLRVAPFMGVGLCVAAVDLSLYASQSPVSLGYSLPEGLLIASRALWFYVGKLLWPGELAVIYPLWDIRVEDASAWAYALAAAAVAACLWFGRRRLGRGPLAGALFFVLTLSPVLGLVEFRFMTFSFVADRFQYLACLGVMGVMIGCAAGAVQSMSRVPAGAARGLLVVALLLLGTLTWRQAGVYRDGVTLFNHVIAANPEARSAYYNLTLALIGADRPEEALATGRVAVERRPHLARTHLYLGVALSMLGQFENAWTSFLRALEIEPRNPKVLHNMGTALGQQGRHEEAVEWYRKGLSIDAGNLAAHACMALSLLRLGRHDEAVQLLAPILSRRPDNPMAGELNLLLGRALRRLGRLDDAATRFQRALAIDPLPWRPLLELADVLTAQGRFEEADAYRRRIREPARVMATLQGEGRKHNEQGRHEEAIEAYRLALALEPADALAQAGMVGALLGLERYEAAIDVLARSAALRPDTPATAAWHVLMGLSLQGLGRSNEAVAHYERAVAADPNDVAALDLLAGWRFRSGRYGEAFGLYRNLLDAGRVDAEIHARMGVALYRLNRPGEALRSFERALSLDPGLESARVWIQRLQEASGHAP